MKVTDQNSVGDPRTRCRRRLILALSIILVSILAWPVALRVRLWTLPRAEAIVSFATRNTSDFQRTGKPMPGDWRYHFPGEFRESFEEYVENYRSPLQERKLIVITPIGPFEPHERDVLEKGAEFIGIWFDRPVRIEEAVPLPASEETFRGFPRRQYDARYLLNNIVIPGFPGDAALHIGATMADLYVNRMNFVFGVGAIRAGVYSIARHFPEFYGQERTPETDRLALRRVCALAAHELGHMLGLVHCDKFRCNMNGANSLEEADRAPLALCPDCLRKLRWRLGFDVMDRYDRLAAFCETHGLTGEARWFRRRTDRINKAVRWCREG